MLCHSLTCRLRGNRLSDDDSYIGTISESALQFEMVAVHRNDSCVICLTLD